MIFNYSPVSGFDFIVKYLEITNIFLPIEQKLTRGEAELVAALLVLPEEKFKYQRFSPLAKRKAGEMLGINTVNINNRIHFLVTKKFLRRDEDRVLYLPNHVVKAYQDFLSSKKLSITFNIPLLDEV